MMSPTEQCHSSSRGSEGNLQGPIDKYNLRNVAGCCSALSLIARDCKQHLQKYSNTEVDIKAGNFFREDLEFGKVFLRLALEHLRHRQEDLSILKRSIHNLKLPSGEAEGPDFLYNEAEDALLEAMTVVKRLLKVDPMQLQRKPEKPILSDLAKESFPIGVGFAQSLVGPGLGSNLSVKTE